MNEKFIDLCVDDNHSAYGNEMNQKHEQFKAHLEKLNFEFKTQSLSLPEATNGDDGQIDIDSLMTADTAMGKDLDDIFNLIDGPAKEQFYNDVVVIDHQWNNAAQRFEENWVSFNIENIVLLY